MGHYHYGFDKNGDDFEKDKDRLVHVPKELILYDGEEKQLLPVYLAVSCKANYSSNHKRVVKLSLRDIIHTLGLTPKSGKGKINEQVVVAINKLRELNCFKDAPDYFEHDYIDTKTKYRYEVVKPKKAKTYVTITPFDVFTVATIARNKSKYDSNGKKRRITFSYETMLRTLLIIRLKIFSTEDKVILLTRDKLHNLVGVSPQTITDITNQLDKAGIIRKRVYNLSKEKVASGEIKKELWQIAFYSNYYNTTEKDVYETFCNYKDHIGYQDS